jgi:hypothetical protein
MITAMNPNAFLPLTSSTPPLSLASIHRVRKIAPKNNFLGADFTPGPYDVVCARGKLAWDHIGNRRFRLLIDLTIDKYLAARTKIDKSILVLSLVDMVREASSDGGGFVKLIKEGNALQWCEVGDITARDKVGHAIRDAIWARQVNGGQAKTMVELFGTPGHQKKLSAVEQTIEDLAQAALRQATLGPIRSFHQHAKCC